MSSSLRIKNFVVPAHVLPRYAYTSNRTTSLLKRYKKRIGDLRLKDEFQIPTYGDVQVYYLHDETSVELSVVHVAGTDREHVQQKTLTLRDYKRKFYKIEKYCWSVFVTPADLLQSHKTLLGPRKILIKHAKEEIRTNEGNDKIICTSPDELPEQIGILLEREVLRILFERLHILQCLNAIKNPLATFATLDEDTTFNSKKVFAKQSEIDAAKLEITKVFQLWYKARCMMIEELIIAQFSNAPTSFKEKLIETMLGNNSSSSAFPVPKIVEDIVLSKTYLLDSVHVEEETPLFQESVRSKVVNLKTTYEQIQRCEQLQESYKRLVLEVSIHRHDIEQLCGEIQGLFYRSMVPLQERPEVMPEMNRVLDAQLAKVILSVKGVTSTGYRFSTLNIFLDASMSVDEKKSTETELTCLMNKRNVLKYVFCYEQKDVTKFSKVGSTISVHNHGTLGGFAALGENKEICVLMARHLADQSDRDDPWVYFKESLDAEDKSPFARVLQPRIKVDRNATLDIALAKVVPEEQHKCKVGFKDEHGKSFPSTLHMFNDLDWLNGLDVHIWGAASSPGRGVIVIPLLYVQNMAHMFLKIEDRDAVGDVEQENARFANKGDSGALVCAYNNKESTLHVLAMLLGSPSHYEVTKNSKQQYIAFRLMDGLHQLQQEQLNEVALL